MFFFSGNFTDLLRNNFLTENLLRTSFQREILRKMANRHSYYKEISQSRELFQITYLEEKKVYLRTIDRKLTLNLVIFNSFKNISFLKYFTDIFFVSHCFQEKNWKCFSVQLQVDNTADQDHAKILQTVYPSFVRFI